MQQSWRTPFNFVTKSGTWAQITRINVKLNVKKIRRGRRKRVKHLKTPIRFLGVNANGLKPRMFTFKKVLKDLKPSVFLVEETKHKEGNSTVFRTAPQGSTTAKCFWVFLCCSTRQPGGRGLQAWAEYSRTHSSGEEGRRPPGPPVWLGWCKSQEPL